MNGTFTQGPGCCGPGPEDQAGFLRRINDKMIRNRVPLSGSIEVTRRCNLRCIHCYLTPESGACTPVSREIDTGRWLAIIDEFTAAGCLDLLITGGEPLLRGDFPAIYRQARTRGCLVSVFTNATLVTDAVATLFKEFPPRIVEVSLYGATAATYERVTGVAGSYERCLRGIRRLRESGVKVGLKTMLMTVNEREFEAISRIAAELGLQFRFDADLFPRFSGDRAPLLYRVSPEAAVDRALADPATKRKWRAYHERNRDLPPGNTVYQCGAGVTGFHVDCAGYLSPCLMVAAPSFPLVASGDFLRGWREEIVKVRDQVADRASYPCLGCEFRSLCAACPAFFKLESGSETLPSNYLCAMARRRRQALESSAREAG